MFGFSLETLLPFAKDKLKEENCKSFIFSLSDNKDGYNFTKKNYDVVKFCEVCEKLLKENKDFVEQFSKISKEINNG